MSLREGIAVSELPPVLLALLGGSEVLHTGSERAVRDTLTEALTTLPFDGPTALRMLAPVAATEGARPHVDSRASKKAATQLLLGPLYPALRALTVREAASAWVLVDFLCLGEAARRLEEDIVQRFMESPGAEADWRSALYVDGCPACDTLWAQVTALYSALRSQWADGVPMPTSFGANTTAAKREKCVIWRRRTCVSAFKAISKSDLGAFAGSLIPLCMVALHHSVDFPVIECALAALGALTSNASLATGCVLILRRFAVVDVDVVIVVSTLLLQAMHPPEHEEVEVVVSDEFIKEGGLALLMSALAHFSADAHAAYYMCFALAILLTITRHSWKPGPPSCYLHCCTATSALQLSCPACAMHFV